MNNKKEYIAYFCMEYGLDNKLPLYAGGLGVLAGDYLKAAKEQNAPVVGIGIRWWQNYTSQYINENGYPYDLFPTYELDEYVCDTGVRIKVKFKDEEVPVKIMKVTKFNNVPLYLLDTGQPDSEYGWITDKLYEGNKEDRIAQEIILGIGGIKALRALNINVKIYHFNEGHAAFAGLELIKIYMKERNLNFEEALQEVRKKIVFTTHTPVPAGNEAHELDLMLSLKANYGLTREQLNYIGGDPFNMTAACLHMAALANGVSRIHGETARSMWSNLERAAPIIHITNGIHLKTWQNKKIKEAFNRKDGLWEAHQLIKQRLLDFIKEKTGTEMDMNTLLIGFARRAAAYKRSGLILRNTDKIDDLLQDGKIQLVFSGKAHPADEYGKHMIAKLVKMDKKYRESIVFIENYDLEIARFLAQGCDVWLNNPRRPMEASGTSGMKAAANGVLNLSVLDGWVAEGINHGETGWILDELFSDFENVENLNEDEKDLRALYRILREEVIPLYYNNRERWVDMMYGSIVMAEKDFSATRMFNEYLEKMYKKISEPAYI